MKYINYIYWISLCCLSFFSIQMKADHFMGGNLSYKTIDSSQGVFEVTLMLERPCNASPLNSEYPISVLENHNGLYQKNVYIIKLVDSNYIQLPCYNSSNTCSNNSIQLIEQKYYRVNIIVQNSSKECIVFFQENTRTSSSNITNPNSPIFLYTSFIPKYYNTQFKHLELKRSISLKNQTTRISYTISDIENDSLQIKSSAPYTGISFTLNNANLNHSFEKCILNTGYNDLKPFAINESQLDINLNAINFTSSAFQQSWLTLIKNEYRKLNIASKDTWIRIGSSNSDRLISTYDLNSQFQLHSIQSIQPNVHITGNTITICNQNDTSKINLRFPIEKSLSANKVLLNFEGQTILHNSSRIIGTSLDTLLINFNYKHNSTLDLVSNLKLEFDLCHSISGLGFSKYFELPITIFNYKIFENDTVLSCSSVLNIPTLISKAMTVSYGNYNAGFQSVFIAQPKDTTIVATLTQSNAYCPFRDTVVLKHGPVFTSIIVGYPPSCKNYSNAAAKVFVMGSNAPFTYRWSNSSTLDSIGSIDFGMHIVEIKDKNNCSQFDTIMINNPSGIDYNWIQDSAILCAGGNNARGHFEITSSIKPSQYLWNHNLSTDSFASNLSKGTYTGKFTYINNSSTICTQNFKIDIADPDSLRIKVITTDNKCYGDSLGKIAIVVTNGLKPYTYSIDNENSNSGLKENLKSGNLSIYVSDSNHCKSSTQIVSINSPTKIAFNLVKQNPSCIDVANGIIGFQDVVGGTYPYSFSVNNSSFSGIVYYPYLPSANYVLKIKDMNNCILSQSTYLSPQYILQATADSIINSRCPKSNSGKIKLTIINGASPYKVFSNQDSNLSYNTNIQLSALPKNTYQIKIKDNNLCTWSASYTITEPDSFSVSAQVKNETCYLSNDGSIQLISTNGGTKPYQNITWKNEQNQSIISTVNLSPGNYKLAIKDDKYCDYEKLFTVNPKSKFIVKIDTIQSIKCINSSDGILRANVIGGSQPLSYKWNNNFSLNQLEFKNLNPGNYTLEVKDNDNCTATSMASLSNPTKINLDDLKIKNVDCPTIMNGGISIICSGGTTILSPLKYALLPSTDFKIHNSFTNLTNGNYRVVVKDDNECRDTFLAEIKQDKSLELSLQDTIHCDLGATVSLVPSLSYGVNTSAQDIKSSTWKPQTNISCIDCIQTEYTANNSGLYYLDILYGSGCLASKKIYIDVAKVQEIYIPNSFTPNGDLKNDTWYVYGKNVKSIDIKILNNVGELVFNSMDINKGWDGTFHGVIMPINSYRYIIVTSYLDGTNKKYDGILNLIR